MYLESPGKVVHIQKQNNKLLNSAGSIFLDYLGQDKVSKKSIMTSFKQKTFDNDSYLVEEEKDLPLSSVPLEVWNEKKGM